MLSKMRTLLVAVACLAVTLSIAPAAAAQASTLPAPADLRVTRTGFDEVSLAWSRVPGAEFYRVLVDGVWRSGVYDPTSGVTVSQLRPGVTYEFEVQARRTDGEFGPGATLRATTLDDTEPPSTPTDLRVARDSGGSSLGLTWDAATDNWGVSPGYHVYADGRFAMVSGAPVQWLWLTDPYHGGLSCGATYTFTVRAMDRNGNLSGHSAPLRTTIPRC